MGKGFGVNLADDDDYQGTVNGLPNRSPHNIQMTVLARAGVPGLVIWSLLQSAFALSLVVAYFRARRERREWWARCEPLDFLVLAGVHGERSLRRLYRGPSRRGLVLVPDRFRHRGARSSAGRAKREPATRTRPDAGHVPQTTPTPSMPQPALPVTVGPNVTRPRGFP
jgi:hypothetical protein